MRTTLVTHYFTPYCSRELKFRIVGFLYGIHCNSLKIKLGQQPRAIETITGHNSTKNIKSKRERQFIFSSDAKVRILEKSTGMSPMAMI